MHYQTNSTGVSSTSPEEIDLLMADKDMEVRTTQEDTLVGSVELKALMERSDRKAWTQVLSHFGAIVLSGYGLSVLWGSWWAVPVFMLHGTLLAYLYAAQHECSHQTPFRTRWLNLFWGHVCGFIGFAPFYFDRTSHMIHHQYTSIRGKDAELEDFRHELEPFTLYSLLYELSAVPYWTGLWQSLYSHTLGKESEWEVQLFQKKDRDKFIKEARIYSSGYILIFALSIIFESWFALQYWLAPMLIMKWSHHLHNYAEHYGLPKVTEVMQNTRTIYTTPFNRWIVWNMNYHTAHHRHANVPFYNLPRLDKIIRSHVAHQVPGYLRLYWKLLRCAWRGERYGYEGLM